MKTKTSFFVFVTVLIISFLPSSLAQARPLEKAKVTPAKETVATNEQKSTETSLVDSQRQTPNASEDSQEQTAQKTSNPPNQITETIDLSLPQYQSTEKIQIEPSTGTSTVTIPIDVPKGRKGIQPSLSLMYNSASPNGILGVGWSLELGSIQINTKKGVPKYDGSDTFVLTQQGSSQELVSIGGNQYRAKIEGAFMKIEYLGAGYAGWLATDKKGIKYYFGLTPDSQQSDGSSRIFKWCLKKVEDLYGNYMWIDYMQEHRQVYPSSVKYTYHSSNPSYYFAEINFQYLDRTDTSLSYRQGIGYVITNKILSEVLVKVDNNLQRRYQFSYSNSSSNNRSLLTSITQYGADNISPLPSTTFTYTTQTPNWSRDYGWTVSEAYQNEASFGVWNGQINGDRGVRLADVNNDGFVDIPKSVEWDGDVCKIYINNKNKNWAVASWSFPSRQDDTLPGFTWLAPEINRDNGVRLVDANGDGWTDIAYHTEWQIQHGGGIKNRMFINNRTSGWAQDDNWQKPDGTQFVAERGQPVYEWRENLGVILSDVDGDGYQDVIKSHGSDRRTYLNNAGNGTTGWMRNSIWDLPDGADLTNGTQMVDLNGDGLSDIVISRSGLRKVYLNNGTGWIESPSYIPPDGNSAEGDTFFADVNGDGLADLIICRGDEKRNTYLNTGNGWQRSTQWDMTDGDFRNFGTSLGDANADGLIDIIKYWANDNELRVYLNNGPQPDLLKTVNNGIGAVTTINYKPSTQYDNTGGDGISDLPFPVQTVSSVTVTDQVSGQSYTSNYEYKNGLFDFQDREFRGFGEVKVIDPEGNYTKTFFEQNDDYKKGRILKQETFGIVSGQPRNFTKTENTWATSPDLGGGSKFVYLSKVDNFIYDGDTSGKRTQNQYFYEESPQYGNPTKTIEYGEVNLDTGDDLDSSDNRESIMEYNYNASAWLLALPKHTYITDFQANIKSQKWFYYDDNPNLDDQPLKGNLTKEEAWLDGGTNPITQFSYDQYGNLLSTTNALERTTSVTYDSTYHFFPLTTTNHLGHTVTNEYYGVNGVALDDGSYKGLWGQVKSLKDPNNNKSYSIYDTFGRVVKTISPYDSLEYPTSSIEYHLESVPIKIISHQREISGQSGTLDSISFYYGLGRLLQTKTESEEANKFIVSGQTEYNSRGLPEKKYLPKFSNNPIDTIDPIDPAGPYISITYDAVGRVTQSTSPDGTYSTIQYDDWVATTINENGHKQKSYSDAFGRLIKKEEYSGADGRSPNYPVTTYVLYATTLYNYDTLGNLIQTKDNSNNITTITYDTLGRKTSMIDPDMGTWSYSYDALGNLTSQIDNKTQTVNFQYDELNRLTKKLYLIGDVVTSVDYTYDDPAVANSKGRLTKVSYTAPDNTKFFYDALGREIKSEKTIDGITYVFEKTYDSAGRLTSVKYPDGEVVTYSYNKAGQIEQVKNLLNADFNTKLLLHTNGQDGSTNFLDSSAFEHSISANGDVQIDTAGYKFGGASALFPGNGGNDSYAKLLLHVDGQNGSSNFADSSSSNHQISAVGNAQTNTAQSKFGGASGLFDGNGDYLTIPDSNDFYFGTGDFTIDFWVKFDDVSTHRGFVAQNQSGFVFWDLFWFQGANVLYFYANNGGNNWIDVRGDWTPTVDTWYHVTVVRDADVSSENWYMFVNGTALNISHLARGIDASTPFNFSDLSSNLNIGYDSDGNYYHSGWLDEIRISKGIARWTNNFTPPSQPYSAPGYLSIPDSDDWNFGTGDFTVDFWYRPVDCGNTPLLMQWTVGNGDIAFIVDGGVKLQMYFTNEAGVEKGNYVMAGAWNPPLNVWYHIAFVRDNSATGSGSGTNLKGKIFINGVAQTLIENTAFGTNDVGNIASNLYIGYNNNVGTPYYLNGWMDEIRISKGIARWTSNFTPPTAPYSSATAEYYVRNVNYSASGQITHLEYGNGVVTDYTYNPLNLRLSHLVTTSPTEGIIQDLSYQYDAVGNILTITDNINTGSQTFSYDSLNRLISADGAAYGAKNYSYNEIGNILSKDGLTFNYGAGSAGPHAVTSLSDGTSFSYDLNGNMISMSGSQLPTTGYEYDFENRLKKVFRNNRLLAQFSYDGDGGRTKKVIYSTQTAFLKESEYQDITDKIVADNQIVRLHGLGFSDKPISSDDHTEKNLKLSQIASQDTGLLTKGADELVFVLKDIFTVREAEARVEVAPIDPGPGGGGGGGGGVPLGPVTTLYVGSLFEKEIYNNITLNTTKHVYLGSQRICSVNSSRQPITRYSHANHLGSTDIVTNGQGSQISHYEYEPYGKVVFTEGLDSTKYKFTGKPFDDETGLYYYGARYYNPLIGRFITPDTIVQAMANPQTLNRYTYCNNNPVNLIDPSGHFAWFIPMIVGAIKGAFIGAAIGAGLAAITGGNIGQGALLGAIGGAFFGGTTGIMGHFAEQGIKFNIGLKILAYAEAGAYSGALGAVAIGADPGRGALFGALSGAVFGGIGDMGGINWKWDLARVGLAGVAGGGISELAGGNFWQGFAFASAIAGADFIYRSMIRTQIDPKTGKRYEKGASMGTAKQRGQTKGEGEIISGVYQDRSNTGVPDSGGEKTRFGKISNFFGGETGPVMNTVAEYVPGINPMSYFHDTLMAGIRGIFGGVGGTLLNFPTMPPSYALNTLGSAINENPALIGQLELYGEESN